MTAIGLQSIEGTPQEIITAGGAKLYEVSKEVEPTSEKVQKVVANLFATAEALGPWAGLAAPQIGENVRIFIYQIAKEGNPAVPPTAVINPTWKPIGEEKNENDWEGCFSIPGIQGRVERYTKIRVNYQTLQGTTVDKVLSNFEARVFQHEHDHLDGKLYPRLIKKWDKEHFIYNPAFAREMVEYSPQK